MLKALALVPSTGLVARICNLGTGEVEEREGQGHLRVHRALEASLGGIYKTAKKKYPTQVITKKLHCNIKDNIYV